MGGRSVTAPVAGPDTVGPARGSRGEERPSVKGEPRQREPCRPWELGTSHNPPVKAKPARIRAAIRRPEPSRLEMSHPGGRSTPGVASDPAVQRDSRRFVRCGRPDQACRGRRHALGIHERQLSQGQSGLAEHRWSWPCPWSPRQAKRHMHRVHIYAWQPYMATHASAADRLECKSTARSSSRRFPVTVTHLPVTRCQICRRTVAYRPGSLSEVLTEHYRRVHPGALGLPSQ